MQIDLTWNLFATPIFMFILYLVLRYHLGQRFTDLMEKIVDNNKEAIERFKENRSTLGKISDCVTSLKVEMEKRVHRDECGEKHDNVWMRIHEIEKARK